MPEITFAFWVIKILSTTTGETFADYLADVIGLSLWVSTVILSVLLAVTFGTWFYRERTLSIHANFTRRREAFDWVAILLTFALGTAAGDLITEGLGLGYLAGAILFASLIGMIVIARLVSRANVVFCSWAARILTRPLGASNRSQHRRPQHRRPLCELRAQKARDRRITGADRDCARRRIPADRYERLHLSRPTIRARITGAACSSRS